MSYTALYRKFRPSTFSEVRGQDHIVTTLRNQIRAERIGHAYLFCGTRGTGKTTVAKILAKAVNCRSPIDGDPCGECPSCQSISSGINTDVTEMDAASNNGVDDMRSLIEEVGYTPGMSRYRVYIVDEVHMLSNSAFNAFLKTLEEPPGHAVFILATTDPQKLPATILSRCQRYDFHRMSLETIVDHMSALLKQEGVEADIPAIQYIARAADGSMRDALSLLDQCIAFHQGSTLTYDSVLDVLGAVDSEVFARLLDHISQGDVGGCMEVLDESVFRGRELSQLITDFTGYVRDVLLFGEGADESAAFGRSSDDVKRMKESAQSVGTQALMRYIWELSELSEKIRYASMKRVLVDIGMIKLCRPQMTSASDGAVEERIALLEKKTEELEKRPIASPSAYQEGAGTASYAGNPKGNAAQKEEKQYFPKAVPEDLLPLKGRWREIISQMDPPAGQYMAGASLTVDEGGGLLLVLRDEVMLGLFTQTPEHEQHLRDVITGMIQKDFDLHIIAAVSGRQPSETYPNIFDGIGMAVEIED